ncbi:prolipoprotein diacylglyceryl transferase [Aerococcus kribbianus]|uniref:Phosphatidylglycerol--prolipoprotein diacylglyceryl transferase n=1 Tax=Aerococcus kribbianus TaxID=2999064 RepID=A0A9X3JGP3_9LACT|nr:MULTISPECIES: prolipoprotein diacylglyceryl transferase [unclassified Aerococcus]MCZ0717486.1 prolipoprotein diacylglyceryl transferase [Aerococcus sp. YH-aer221]MCZ0725774.1 prolipoprotein diacylglyceryl transferase [Aerococcus sp. YH-aer222]
MLNFQSIFSHIAAIDPVAFRFFGWPIYWYGIIIGLAIFLGISLAGRELKKKGFDEDIILDMMVWAIPLGFLGARLYYVIFEWDYYQQNLGEILAIWNGGIAIYGGVIAGGLTAYFYAKRRQINPIFILDVAAPYLLLAQAMGRWGNFINQEAHGGPVSEDFLRNTLHLPNFIVEGMHIDGVFYQPTFLYESLWNFLGVAFLLVLRGRDKTLKLGETSLLYLLWYSFGRFFIEGLRTDSLYIGPLRVSQVLAGILVLLSLALIIYRRKQDHTPLPYYSEIEGPDYQ